MSPTEPHYDSLRERYPKGQEAVWASASSCALAQKQQISSHQACRPLVTREDITQKDAKTIPLHLEREVKQYGELQYA